MDQKVKKILGIGLSGGYGSSNYGKSTRAGFELDLSDYSGLEGKYHDEWAAHENGGGQELVEIEGEKATRVYAGGSLNPAALKKIGLTEDVVSTELKYFLKSLGDKSRLDENKSDEHGQFKYTYKVLKNVDSIPVIVGEEEIRYGKDNVLVFVHYHINSPVK